MSKADIDREEGPSSTPAAVHRVPGVLNLLHAAIHRAFDDRRMEAGEFNTVTDLAKAVGLAERHVSRQLRLAYLAPGVLKRLVYKREVPAVTLLKLTDVAALPWHEQPERVFDDG